MTKAKIYSVIFAKLPTLCFLAHPAQDNEMTRQMTRPKDKICVTRAFSVDLQSIP